MASVAQELRSLFSPEQLSSLDAVRGVMREDPTVFDTHSREQRLPQPSDVEKVDG